MNVSLMKDSKFFGGSGSGDNSKNGGKKRSKARRESLAKAAAAAALRSLSNPDGGGGGHGNSGTRNSGDFRRDSGGDTSDLEVGVGRGMTVTLTSRGHEIATFDEEDEIFLDAGILHRSLFLACSLFGGLPPLYPELLLTRTRRRLCQNPHTDLLTVHRCRTHS